MRKTVYMLPAMAMAGVVAMWCVAAFAPPSQGALAAFLGLMLFVVAILAADRIENRQKNERR